MFRKTVILFLLTIIISFSANQTICFAEEAVLYMARMNVCNLIESGNFAEAKSAADTLISDFSGNSGMPEALYWIGERYERFDKFEDAKQNYLRIIIDYPNSIWTNKAKIGISRADIKALIVSRKYSEAESAFDKFISDFAANPDLPEAIFWITERFQRLDKFAEAKKYYQRIIQNYPQNPYAKNSRILLSRVNIFSLIASGNFEDANDAVDKLTSDFVEHPGLPEALYWIAERYERSSRFDDANSIYQQISQNYPDSPWKNKAKFRLTRTNIISLVESQDFNGAKAEFDKFNASYSDNPEFPEAAYWIAERFERFGRFDESDLIYRQISENFPNSPWAERGKLDASKAKVIELVISEKYDLAKETLEKFIADFSGHQRLPGTLYWIAERYERQGKFTEANRLYRQIAANYPENSYADKSRFDIRETDIRILLDANEVNEAEILTDKFIADFRQDPFLPQALFFIAEKYNGMAHRNKAEGNEEKAKEFYKKGISVLEKIVTQLLPSSAYTPQACLTIAYVCFEDAGEFEKAIEYCEKAVINWPQYQYACELQFLSGNYYERMVQAGLIPEAEANPIIEETYEALIEKYPDCEKVKNALLKLAEINFSTEKWAKAANYYELLLIKFTEGQRPVSILYSLGQTYDNIGNVNETIRVYNEFLLKANIGDPRIENVKHRLEQLRGSVKTKSILSDVLLSSIYGGCTCEGSGSGSGMCTISSNGGQCTYPNCNLVSGCDCGANPKSCNTSKPYKTCVPDSPPCGTCTLSRCHINEQDKTCLMWPDGVPTSCSGSYPSCYAVN